MRITGLYVHPIKSCAGIRVPEAELDERGLRHDRRHMVTTPEGLFVTLRNEPRMAFLRLAMEPGGYRLSFEGTPGPLVPEHVEGDRGSARVWDDTVTVCDVPEASRFVSEMLGRPLRVVGMPVDVRRPVGTRAALPTDEVSFADAYPLLLLSEASLADLSVRVGRPLEMERFRPNVVVDGLPPYGEDELAIFELGGVPMRGPKLCSRCVATTVDPATADKGVEPLASLARFRKWNGQVWFGMNVLHDAQGTLRVGDELIVRRRHDARPLG